MKLKLTKSVMDQLCEYCREVNISPARLIGESISVIIESDKQTRGIIHEGFENNEQGRST